MLRNYFRIFQDWYANPEYCNYIGYLVRYKSRGLEQLIQIIVRYEQDSHSEFLTWLKHKVISTVVSYNIEELSYDEKQDKSQLKDFLLLFSIITATKLGERFDFNPSGGWSLEHIFAQKSEIIKPSERISWLQKYLNSNIIEVVSRGAEDKVYRSNLKMLKEDIVAFIAANRTEDDAFKELFIRIGDLVEHYCISNVHSISNLALLGKDDNSSLNNAPFYAKRGMIITMAHRGKSSIPQSTLNVFQKVYSTSSDDNSVYRGNLDIWSKQDSEAYFRNIKSELLDFGIEEGKNDE